ncbi:c-type cytochrome [Arenibacterium sp. CAU 1754]
MKFSRYLSGLALICAATAASAQDEAQSVKDGAEVFRLHCATCHGIEATGQGPMAGVMVIKPADLTTLTERNDGVFPTENVVMRIDGRDPLQSHGSPMPVYGFFFEGKDASLKAPNGQPILTSQPIVDLVAYLQSMQIR